MAGYALTFKVKLNTFEDVQKAIAKLSKSLVDEGLPAVEYISVIPQE